MARHEVRTDRADEDRAGRAVTLADVLAAHGPLAEGTALVVALSACADASALEPDVLRQSLGSLATAHIRRDRSGRWRWQPAPAGALDHRPTDNEVSSRLGAVLFECLTGSPLAEYLPQPTVIRSRLRDSRPNLTQAVEDLTARLASAQSAERQSLDGVALDIRRVIGVTEPSRPVRHWRRWSVVVGAVGLVTGVAIAVASYPDTLEVASHGLTREETTLSDLATEASDHWTSVREFITAFAQLDGLERLWRSRVPADDPRLDRIHFRQAWARMERGDFITAEQYLTSMLGPLERAFGPSHPYIGAIRLHLAGVLDRRGADAAAGEQRELAAAIARTLLSGAGFDAGPLPGGPPGPGLLAHVAPHPPEQEWFRRRDDDAYFSPLTSTARWLAGERGWRLHLAAAGDCAATVDAGREPRRIGLSIRRTEHGASIRVDGVRPAVEFTAPDSSAPVHVALDVASDGQMRIWSSRSDPHLVSIDHTVAPPPYGLTFVGLGRDNGCTLVWWEIKPRA